MKRLTIRLLGAYEVSLDGTPVQRLTSDKARALLAYLAVEAKQAHSRDKLVGLLWPDCSEGVARANLRRALYTLRQAIRDEQAQQPFLLISRQTVQFNCKSESWVDVSAFQGLLDREDDRTSAAARLEEAVEVYRGGFLEGFFVEGSAAFDDWALLTRERLQRQALGALSQLARHYAASGELERACEAAWRQVELEPWREAAYEELMRLLALAGRRAEALAQYEVCRRRLADELGVEPSPATTRLYERIRDGKLGATAAVHTSHAPVCTAVPSFLTKADTEAARPVFVARERELAALEGFLGQALAGDGRVAFVAGEAGSGKTVLIEEFARRAQQTHPELVVAGGRGMAYTGAGDAYLPFRDILELLTGDVEARYSAGTMSFDHAMRLWMTLPYAAEALVKVGPDLIDTFIPGAALLDRAFTCDPGGAAWLTRLEELLQKKADAPLSSSAQQSDLFEQFTHVLAALAGRTPLLLLLDDLQWADSGSIDLLFHLGRSLAGQRILMLGAYRPEEIAAGRAGPWTAPGQSERHPLDFVLHEFQRQLGDITITVGQAGDRAFVDAYVDSEPNRLYAEFRAMLFRQTRGHALFTAELLRGLQERGDLLKDQGGRWVEGPALNWDEMPPRVEGVIGQRIGRLPKTRQQELRVASVQGEVFTAEVLARVRGADERDTVQHLSGELSRAHRLVSADSLQRVGEQSLSNYRFRHFLFQKYLYGHLDSVERAQLHRDTGNVLEELYQDLTDEVAVQLAHHYEEAGLVWKAVQYLHQAGNRCVRQAASQEAIAHFARGLDLLSSLPEGPQRDETEFALQIALGAPLVATRGYGVPEIRRAWGRAFELLQRMPDAPELAIARYLMATYYMARGEFHAMLNVTQQMIDTAKRRDDPESFPLHHAKHGVALFHLGQFLEARAHLEEAAERYVRERDCSLTLMAGQDMGMVVLCFLGWTLWCLGYPDRALQRCREAVALAEDLEHTFSLVLAECLAGWLSMWRHDTPGELRQRGEALAALSRQHGFGLTLPMAMSMKAWAQLRDGAPGEGEIGLRQGLAAWEAIGAEFHTDSWCAWLAEGCVKTGRVQEAHGLLEDALAYIARSDQRSFEAEILRRRGELYRLEGDETEAEADYRAATEVARKQQAKSWELRATTSLCRLLQGQGKREEAREMLSEIYDWFTEGFDTTDLQEAKALLAELQS